VRRATLSDLINGNAALSAEMALRIEKAFGVKMETLLNMEAWHDAYADAGNGKVTSPSNRTGPLLPSRADLLPSSSAHILCSRAPSNGAADESISGRQADPESKANAPPAVSLLTDPGGYFSKSMSRFPEYLIMRQKSKL
jgi:hypothetical protein